MSNVTKAGKKYQNLNLSHIFHQVCRSEQYSLSADIWELMCTFYKMLVGKPPWREVNYFPLLFEVILIKWDIHANRIITLI